MTNNKCSSCNIRPIDYNTQGRDSWACEPCFDYAGWENTHNDESHNDYQTEDQIKQNRIDFGDVHVDVRLDEMRSCPVCNPKLDTRFQTGEIYVPRKIPAQLGNKNASGKQMSHAMCAHAPTKAARQRCRVQRRKNTPADEPVSVMIKSEPAQVFVINWERSKIVDRCPKCNAIGDEPCKTASGGRVKSNKGRHPQRDA